MVALDPENAALLAAEGVAMGDVIGVCGATGAKPKPLTAWYGGKARLAPIIARMVEKIPHKNYVEPFAGMCGVLMAKRPSFNEIINDKHEGVINLFRVVQNPTSCAELIRRLEFTPHARAEWRYCQEHWESETNPIERARMLYVVLAQNFVGVTSHGSWSFGGPNYKGNPADEFANSLPNIIAVCRRFRNVTIDCADALTIMRQWNTENTIIYADPPYLLTTRNGDGYLHETGDAYHTDLLDFCASANSAIILSGYPSEFYSAMLERQHGWVRIDISALSAAAMNSTANGRKNNPNAKTAKRIECLWLNPLAQKYQQHSLWEGLSA